jgi:hypothetical protein
VHWREREHEDISALVGEDPNFVSCVNAMWIVEIFSVSFHVSTT